MSTGHLARLGRSSPASSIESAWRFGCPTGRVEPCKPPHCHLPNLSSPSTPPRLRSLLALVYHLLTGEAEKIITPSLFSIRYWSARKRSFSKQIRNHPKLASHGNIALGHFLKMALPSSLNQKAAFRIKITCPIHTP